ncbi:MAG: hypothetical protein AABZ74_05005 [Cyanobacteriota bacterium]
MQNDLLLTNIKDFFESEGIFEIRKKYYGMAASQSQEPFYDYLKKLSFNEKEKTIFYLMDIFLENIKELEKYIFESSSLTQFIIITEMIKKDLNIKDILCKKIILIENEINKYDLINYIKEIDDNEYNRFFYKENYKSNWRYTIKLLNLLIFCKSEKYNHYFKDIIENSKSEKIKDILLINKNIFSGNIYEIDF